MLSRKACKRESFAASEKVNLHCLLTFQIGPAYLPPRLNGELYLEFLQNQLPNLIYPPDIDIDDLPLLRRNIIYQHDGAPAHFASKHFYY